MSLTSVDNSMQTLPVMVAIADRSNLGMTARSRDEVLLDQQRDVVVVFWA
jgi:hypothetical protein